MPTYRKPKSTRSMRTHIAAAMERATPRQVADGMAWYPNARSACQGMSDVSGLPIDACAAVVAVLSPRVRWERNILDAMNVALRPDTHPACVTFGANVRKAEAIARGVPWRDVLSGRKVTAFVANIMGDLDQVTVDVWAMRCATHGLRDSPKSDRDYAMVADGYRTVAGALGIEPASCQAIAWIVTREST